MSKVLRLLELCEIRFGGCNRIPEKRIDPNILKLVRLINQARGFRTTMSCEGHVEEIGGQRMWQRPFIHLQMVWSRRNVRFMESLQRQISSNPRCSITVCLDRKTSQSAISCEGVLDRLEEQAPAINRLFRDTLEREFRNNRRLRWRSPKTPENAP